MQYRWEPTEQEEKLIRNSLMKDWPENFILRALHRAKVLGLDPLAEQIYFDLREGRDKRLSLVVTLSIDAQRLIAERTGKYAGQDGPFWCGKDGEWRDVWIPSNDQPQPFAARVGIRRKDFDTVLWAVCRFEAYAGYTRKDRNGARVLNHFWSKMGDNQIAKCAEAAGLRRAFPNELGRCYIAEEINHDNDDGADSGKTDNGESATRENADPNRTPGARGRSSAESPRNTTTRRNTAQGGRQPSTGNGNSRAAQQQPQTTADGDRETRIRDLARQLELSADELETIRKQQGGDVIAMLERRLRERKSGSATSETRRSGANTPDESGTPGNTARAETGDDSQTTADGRTPGSTREEGAEKPPSTEGRTMSAEQIAKKINDGMNHLKLNSDKRRELRQKHPKPAELLSVLRKMAEDARANR